MPILKMISMEMKSLQRFVYLSYKRSALAERADRASL